MLLRKKRPATFVTKIILLVGIFLLIMIITAAYYSNIFFFTRPRKQPILLQRVHYCRTTSAK